MVKAIDAAGPEDYAGDFGALSYGGLFRFGPAEVMEDPEAQPTFSADPASNMYVKTQALSDSSGRVANTEFAHGVADAAQAAAVQRANHTGSQAISTVTGLQDALDGKANTDDLMGVLSEVLSELLQFSMGFTTETVAGTSFSLESTYGGYTILCTSNSPVTITIQNDVDAEASVPWTGPFGDIPAYRAKVNIMQLGSGAVTVVGDGFSVVTHAEDTNVLDGNGAAATLIRLGPDDWRLFGRLVAA
jgi:hypothetical protein